MRSCQHKSSNRAQSRDGSGLVVRAACCVLPQWRGGGLQASGAPPVSSSRLRVCCLLDWYALSLTAGGCLQHLCAPFLCAASLHRRRLHCRMLLPRCRQQRGARRTHPLPCLVRACKDTVLAGLKGGVDVSHVTCHERLQVSKRGGRNSRVLSAAHRENIARTICVREHGQAVGPVCNASVTCLHAPLCAPLLGLTE